MRNPGVHYWLLPICLVGCAAQSDNRAVESEIVHRFTYGVGKSIRKARQELGLPRFRSSTKSSERYLSVCIVGPKSVDGKLQFSNGEPGRYSVTSLKDLANCQEDGIAVQAVLEDTQWPDKLIVTYTSGGKKYQYSVKPDHSVGGDYVVFPTNLTLDKVRPKEIQVKAAFNRDNADDNVLICVEKVDGRRVFYSKSK